MPKRNAQPGAIVLSGFRQNATLGYGKWAVISGEFFFTSLPTSCLSSPETLPAGTKAQLFARLESAASSQHKNAVGRVKHHSCSPHSCSETGSNALPVLEKLLRAVVTLCGAASNCDPSGLVRRPARRPSGAVGKQLPVALPISRGAGASSAKPAVTSGSPLDRSRVWLSATACATS